MITIEVPAGAVVVVDVPVINTLTLTPDTGSAITVQAGEQVTAGPFPEARVYTLSTDRLGASVLVRAA